MTEQEQYILNEISITPGVLEDVCAKKNVTEQDIWDGFQNIMECDRHRHTSDASVLDTACIRAAECYEITQEQGREIYEILKTKYGRRRR